MDNSIVLDRIQSALVFHLLNKGTHSSAILRCYYIDKEDGQINAVREVMNLLRQAVENSGTQLIDEGSNSRERNHH